MKMIIWNITCVFMLLAIQVQGQKIIAKVALDGTSTFYQKIDSAIYYASAGDFIYLPGGNFNIGNLIIDKNVTIIGAGHYPDSTLATGITFLNGNIKITDAASNGSLSGIYLSGNLYYGTSAINQAVQNYTIQYCNLNGVYLSFDGVSYNANSMNTNFSYNIVRGLFNGGDARDLYIRNNIIVGGGYYHLYFITSAEVSNNIFLDGVFNDYVTGTIFQNNIFYDYMGGNATPNTSSNNIYMNNIYVGGALTQGGNGALIVSNNHQMNASDIFMNQAGNLFSYTSNYHLQTGVNGVLMGLDNTEVGVYGTLNPYKDGALPLNPHIQFKQIGSTTTPNGMINVDIKVNAQ
ncbi:MAG: hypothetical protein ACK5B9_10125 [Flavobacteriia bacterium]|jgi:hypothetical protein